MQANPAAEINRLIYQSANLTATIYENLPSDTFGYFDFPN
jgi:hypothetical protein